MRLAKARLEQIPDSDVAFLTLADCYEALGDYPKWAQALEQYSLSLDHADYAEATRDGFRAGGYQEATRRYLRVALHHAEEGLPANAGLIFQCYLRLHDNDEAMRWLTKMVDEKSLSALREASSPLADGLRSDPRFIALTQRIGLARLASLH